MAPFVQQLPNDDFTQLLGISPSSFFHLLLLYCTFLLRSPSAPRSSHQSPDDELVLALLFLRHYPVDVLLAFSMRIPKLKGQRTRRRLLSFLYGILHPRLSMHSAQFRRASGVEIFDHLFTHMFDGTEQRVYAADDIILDARFFSAKKGQPSINIQITIAFDGTFLALSPSYPGSTSDAEIAIATQDQWYSLLEEDEWGLADNGYDSLVNAGWRTLTPPRGQRNATYKLIAHYRIKVEQMIEQLKNFRVCKEQLRIPVGMTGEEVLAFHQQVYTIVAVLINEYR